MADEAALSIVGVAGVQASLAGLAMLFPTRAAQSLNGIAEKTMTDAKERTPVDTGRLRGSGHVTQHATRENLYAVLTFGTDYAVFVHEITNAHHETGEAKFLEHAVQKAALTFEDDLLKGMGLNW